MTYETMDWDAEAKRVARAFGFKRRCQFRNMGDWRGLMRDRMLGLSLDWPILPNGLTLEVFYDRAFCSFCLKGKNDFESSIQIFWDGTVRQVMQPQQLNLLLPRALFHLDLLTPEVEAALGVSISAHEKMEWAFEDEARQNP